MVHRLRGRASNRKLPAKTQKQAMAILREPDWHDFGPTFAAEQLAKHHRIHVGKETLRGWMIAAGMWQPGSRRIQDVHSWRPRRSGFGELVQWDTSDHDWLEGRGPVRLSGADDRRRDQLELGTVRGKRCDSAEYGRALGVSGEERADGGRVHGSRLDVHGGVAAGRDGLAAASSRSSDATGACFTGTGNRLHSGVFATGQGTY